MRTTAAAIAGLLLAGQCLAGPTPEERYREAAGRLTPCQYCIGINDTPKDVAALEDVWKSAEDLIVARLISGRTIEQIQTEMLNRQTAGMIAAPTSFVTLGPDLYGITNDTLDTTGTAFIVGKREGRFEVLWDIRHLPERDLTQFPMLKAWSAKSAADSCRSHTPDDHWRECGPLSGDFRLLSPDAHGHIRFLLDATYGQMAETTVGAQLSVWTWDGETAKPVWGSLYGWNFEDVSRRLEGEFLKYRVTAYWHTLFACGSCIGRQMDWTLRLRPDGVDDLGMKPVVPELDAFDELAWRIFKGENADDLATPEVLRDMRAIVAEEKAGDKALMGKDYDPNWFSFGMLVGHQVLKVRGGSELCLVTDSAGPFRIHFEQHSGRMFLGKMTRYTGEFDFDFCSKPAP
jgi:hypothetical protein